MNNHNAIPIAIGLIASIATWSLFYSFFYKPMQDELKQEKANAELDRQINNDYIIFNETRLAEFTTIDKEKKGKFRGSD